MGFPKKYKTRDGRDAEVWKDTGLLLGCVKVDDRWMVHDWNTKGQAYHRGECESALDLILPPELAVGQVWKYQYGGEHTIFCIDGNIISYKTDMGVTVKWDNTDEKGLWHESFTFLSAPEPVENEGLGGVKIIATEAMEKGDIAEIDFNKGTATLYRPRDTSTDCGEHKCVGVGWEDLPVVPSGSQRHISFASDEGIIGYLSDAVDSPDFLGYVYDLPWGDTVIAASPRLWADDRKCLFFTYDLDHHGEGSETPLVPTAVRWNKLQK